MKKMYLRLGEVVDRAEIIMREIPVGFQFGIELFTNGSHPPYLRIWFDGMEEGEVHEWEIEDHQFDAETILRVLNEMRKEVNRICNECNVYESLPSIDLLEEDMPF